MQAADRDACPRIAASLAGAGVRLYQLGLEVPNLEDVFLDIVRQHATRSAA